MKKFFVAMGSVAFAVVGCGDDSSSSAGPNDDPVSSSKDVILSGDSRDNSAGSSTGLSSSETFEKSSSSVQSSAKESSSSAEESSSSFDVSSSSSAEESSSSVKASSSSFGPLAVPCKTETEDNCEYGSLTDERDGKTYKTVKIYKKWWMAENLDYADSVNTPSLKGKSWCYADDPENCAKYGRLYTWAAAIDSVKFVTDAENPQDCGDGKSCKNILPDVVQGICPDGWHLPDYDEVSKLLPDVGGYSIAGTVLKSRSGWNDGGNGKDVYGFNVLPAGIRLDDGSFDGVGEGTDFWSATEQDPETAHTLYFYYEYEYAGVNFYEKGDAFSVRCVKD